MTARLYELAISAVGEVRDAGGDLVSSEPVETTITVTEAQLRELGLHHEGDQS